MRNRETDDYDSKRLKGEIQARKDHLEKEYPVIVLGNGKVLEYGDIPREPIKKKGKEKMKMNWFNRHLNITLVLSWIIALFVAYLTGLPFGNPTVLIFLVIFIFTVEFWYLKQKHKPLWYVILNFLPVIGWIWMLFL